MSGMCAYHITTVTHVITSTCAGLTITTVYHVITSTCAGLTITTVTHVITSTCAGLTITTVNHVITSTCAGLTITTVNHVHMHMCWCDYYHRKPQGKSIYWCHSCVAIRWTQYLNHLFFKKQQKQTNKQTKNNANGKPSPHCYRTLMEKTGGKSVLWEQLE